MLNAASLPNTLAPAPQTARPASSGQAGAPTAADEAPDPFARQLAQAQAAKAAAAQRATAAREMQEGQLRAAGTGAAEAKAAAPSPADATAEATAGTQPSSTDDEGPATDTAAGATDPSAWLAALLPGGASRLARGRGAEGGEAGGTRRGAAPGPAGVGAKGGAAETEGAAEATGAAEGGRAQAGATETAGRFAAALADASAAQAEAGSTAPAAPRGEAASLAAADATRALATGDAAPATGTPASGAPEAGAASSAPFHAQLAAALDSPAFAPALGAQVSMLVRDGIQQARLELNPADMGPISVQIELSGTQAHVSFGADLAATRSVLESSVPDLAAALSAGGFTLAGGGVFAQTGGDGGLPGRHGGDNAGPRGGGAAPDDLPAPVNAHVQLRPRGAVDLVA